MVWFVLWAIVAIYFAVALYSFLSAACGWLSSSLSENPEVADAHRRRASERESVRFGRVRNMYAVKQ
jgi:hypothetical protein